MKLSEDWAKVGGIVIAAAALTLLLLTGPRLLGDAAGPEPEIITELKRRERDGLKLMLPGIAAPLTAREAYFDRVTVRVEPGAQRAEALATLDFTGALGETQVSSLGVELVPFAVHERTWAPEKQLAPRLEAVVIALEARRRALDTGDTEAMARLTAPALEDGGAGQVGGSVGVGAAALEQLLALKGRRYRADAWFIRLERDEATVTERWHLEGDLPSRPVNQQGESQLILIRRGEEFLFSSALR